MMNLREVHVLKNENNLYVTHLNKTYYGSNQGWFDQPTRVAGGCGSICALNFLQYLEGNNKIKPILPIDEKSRLDWIYNKIKPFELTNLPGFHKSKLPESLGIYSVRSYRKKFSNILKQEHIPFTNKTITYGLISVFQSYEKKKKQTLDFIIDALGRDCPVCFLNTFLDASLYLVIDKDQIKLHSFKTHWVLVTGLFEDSLTREYYLQCSTWGDKAYFKLDEFLKNRTLLSTLFPVGMTIFDV